MADNTTAAAGPSVATDDIGGVHYQRVKVVHGADGSATDVSLSSPLPTVLNASLSEIGRVGELRAGYLAVSSTAAAGSAVTVTLPAPGAGFSQFITGIYINLYTAAARTGSATPIVVTSTNFPGALAWTFPTVGAIGSSELQIMEPTTPIKALATNTAMTIVAPAVTGGIWRVNVLYANGI